MSDDHPQNHNLAQDSELKNDSLLSSELFRTIVETTIDGFLICDREGKILDANSAYCHLSGYRREELLAMNLRALKFNEEATESIDQITILIEKNKLCFETKHRTKWNEALEVEVNASYLAIDNGQICAFYRDITHRKQAEQAVREHEEHRRQTQKIEAIGRLAGGLAHDFNNFLAIIMLHIDMLNLQLPADSPLRYRISEIKTATNTAAGMVRQLLAFSRKQMLQPRSLILNQVVFEAGKILRRLISEQVELELKLDPNLGICSVDPDQIMQVLMNLIVNARDAMPKGGKMIIETTNIEIDNESPKHKAQPAGSYIQLTISDNGVGMDAETQERIFEPFFTTKPAGKGTGLGLATVYGIVKQSGGFIWVSSSKGAGTNFTIQFPRVQELLVHKQSDDATGEIPSGKETILLVEDEELIRRATHELLNVLGYSVLVAENGLAALQLAQIFDKPIHLLLTDVVMPKMNGRELAEKMKEIHPETIVLFMSGYTDDIITQHGILEEGTNFLEKPFAPSILALKIREILDAKHNLNAT